MLPNRAQTQPALRTGSVLAAHREGVKLTPDSRECLLGDVASATHVDFGLLARITSEGVERRSITADCSQIDAALDPLWMLRGSQ